MFFVEVSIDARDCQTWERINQEIILKRRRGKFAVKIINKAIVSVPFIWIALSSGFLNIFFLFLCVITRSCADIRNTNPMNKD